MFPFRDRLRPARRPWVTWALLAVNVAVFVWEWSLPADALQAFLVAHAVVPARLSALDLGRPSGAWTASLATLRSMFLHGGWLHLIFNMWYLWIFGDNVEDRVGHGRFLLLYVACGAAATTAHVWSAPHSTLPTVGASGAIAGVLGAYFVTYPTARVVTLIPIFFYVSVVELPAWVLLGAWFALQFLSGAAALASTAATGGGVAWWAHVGGFVSGMILMPLLRIGRPASRSG